MKLNNHNPHDHSGEKQGLRHIPNKIKQYLQSLYTSRKCEKMPRGSLFITRGISWARGDNWRRNTTRSLKKFLNKHNK